MKLIAKIKLERVRDNASRSSRRRMCVDGPLDASGFGEKTDLVRVWTALWMQVGLAKKLIWCDSARVSGLYGAAARPLAQMGSATHSQTDA